MISWPDALDGCTLERLATCTGYNRKQLRHAKRALRQTWRRAPIARRDAPYVLSTRQIEELLEYLARPQPFITRRGARAFAWSKQWACCVVCGTDGNEPGQRHAGKGRCNRCRVKEWRARKKAMELSASSPVEGSA